jgi:hypothetical protein
MRVIFIEALDPRIAIAVGSRAGAVARRSVLPPSTAGDPILTPYTCYHLRLNSGRAVPRSTGPGATKSLCANRECPLAGQAATGIVVRHGFYQIKSEASSIPMPDLRQDLRYKHRDPLLPTPNRRACFDGVAAPQRRRPEQVRHRCQTSSARPESAGFFFADEIPSKPSGGAWPEACGLIELLFCEALKSYKIIYTGLRPAPRNGRKSLKTLVGGTGLEPVTSCF